MHTKQLNCKFRYIEYDGKECLPVYFGLLLRTHYKTLDIIPPLLPVFIPHCVIQTGCLAKATGCSYLPLCHNYPSLPLHLTLTLNDYVYRVQLLRIWWSLNYKGTKFLAYFLCYTMGGISWADSVKKLSNIQGEHNVFP
jgi:hypothetical protein